MKSDLVRSAAGLFEASLVLPGEGNLSLRLPGEDAMILTPTMNRYADLGVEDLVVMSFDGEVDERRSGSRAPSSEYRLHAAIYRHRPRANAVVHAHPPEAAAHAVLGRPIPMIMEEMAALIGGAVPCAPYRRTGTDDLVEAVLANLGSGNAVMLAHHGLLTCGRSLGDAMDAMTVVEKLAGIHRRARSLAEGRMPEPPDADRAFLLKTFRDRFSTT